MFDPILLKKVHFVKTSRTEEEIEKNLSYRVHLSDLNSQVKMVKNEKQMLAELLKKGNIVYSCKYNNEGYIESLSLALYNKTPDIIHFPFLYFLSMPLPLKSSAYIDFIKRHKSVKFLILNGSRLVEIPDLSGLTTLEFLDLSRNNIKELNWFGDLPRLRSLYLSHNQIENLQGFNRLENCVNLREIDLSYNNISDLCNFETISLLTNLRYINLCYNKVTDINISYNVPNLTDIYLEHNQITHITAVKNFSSLKHLNLRHNEISKLENLSNLPNLYKISVDGNPIEAFYGLENVPSLKIICYISKEVLPKDFVLIWEPYFKKLGFKFYWPQDDPDSLYIRKPKFPSLKFQVNDYLSLKLDSDTGKTIIQVSGKDFITCLSLVLQISTDKISMYDEIKSIDDLEDLMGNDYHEGYNIPPETEFWGHCSNLQAWYELGYDTRILVKHLAFPLLERLTEAGDPQAKQVFKEEIAARYKSKHTTVVEYLKQEGYLNYLTKDELSSLK